VLYLLTHGNGESPLSYVEVTSQLAEHIIKS